MVKIPPVNTSSVDWNLTMANSAQLWQIKLIHPGQNWYYFEAHISSLFSPKGIEGGVKDQLSAIFLHPSCIRSLQTSRSRVSSEDKRPATKLLLNELNCEYNEA